VAKQYALSLKQPWAALLVHGHKTVEVRRWPTARRGRVLIHAARVPDERPEAWERVPPRLRDDSRLFGGILGAADLTDCRVYRSLDSFLADRVLHLNEPGWFRPPRLYGFAFANAVALPFRPCPGWMRFFEVDQPPQRGAEEGALRPALLVSVRSAEEAGAALAGGAALIDVKEPARGALGRADDETIAAVVRAVGGQVPVSAALGEWRQPGAPAMPGATGELAYLKWGLAGCGGLHPWGPLLRTVGRHLAERHPGVAIVAVAYADWRRAQAPRPDEVCAWACERGGGAFLLDTWGKDGSTLLDWAGPEEVAGWCGRCRAAGVRVALAGSLGPGQIRTLLPAAPDWFAVRGAACAGRRREAAIDAGRVRELAGLLAEPVTGARRGG
jgi:uncharacterized protein (UPF0264 family)